MTSYLWLLLLIPWLPLTFLLHNALHESSHAIVARAAGAEITGFWLFPNNHLGRFTFAYVTYRGKIEGKMYLLLLVAPLIIETLWIIIMGSLLIIAFSFAWPLLVKLLLIGEILSALTDMTTWWIGWFRKSPNTDGFLTRTYLQNAK